MNLKVEATVDAGGNVVCKLTCEGQEAEVTFTGTEVLLAIPEPAQKVIP